MKTRSIVLVGLSAAMLLLLGAGCYSSTASNNNTNSTTNTAASGNTVSIQGLAFSPASLTVVQGTTVTWTNNDSVSHTVTGDQGGPNSGTLAPGQSYSFTFSTVGSFPFHCSIHPSMTGTITVTQ